ncbi:Uma2 family endonuclease [Synechocystis sp. PCC 7339]|uniref:Uma2 family endonuclease n=1 Tax=unclassified Synechocystis TaxID=2640012 RepID=UPI001BAF4B1D|nr:MULTISPECIES: Uma2 family endonuclease [unclassified Synechocystis]QUS60986.1 Uma2 family endonuclease [Synechocystis sp. PCC 7338]UAJ73170.1 Uma2 family endonuclease [Synechocystis sp. PCC 7339]
MSAALTIKLDSISLSDEQFYQLCLTNRELRFERNCQGDLVIMSPTEGETSNRNGIFILRLGLWAERDGTGIFFDSSGGFRLPNGADRSPDAAWLKRERWESLTPEQQQRFVPLCPDFVVELRSPSDDLKSLREKMQEYQENGARLGWLIDRQTRTVEIYRPGQAVEVLENPESLSGEAILPEFVLELAPIW